MLNLITINEYKTYKGINSDAYDPIISLLIGSVTEFIKEYLGRNLIDYSNIPKVEYFDATSYPEYYPKEFPLLSVSELAVSSDGGISYTPLVVNTDYFVDSDNDKLINNTVYYGFSNSTIPFKSGKLTYRGGYITCPLDIKLAAMDLVHYYRNEEHAPSKAMQGASIDNPVLIIRGNELPMHIKRVLDNYRVL